MTTRRGSLTGAGGGVVSAKAAPQPSAASYPDAELLKTCAAFDELEHHYIDLGRNWPAGATEEAAVESGRDRLSNAQEPLVARICELVAITREGQAARVRSLALWDAELFNKVGQERTGDRLVAAIVLDCVGCRTLVGSATASSPPLLESGPVRARTLCKLSQAVSISEKCVTISYFQQR